MQREEAVRLDAVDPLARYRSAFVIDPSGPIYLDGNSLGRLSTATARRLAEGVEAWGRRLVGGWQDWLELPTVVGDRLGALIGAGPGQVVIADSTTVNLYKLASAALGVLPEPSLLVGDASDFPTDRYVLEGLAQRSRRELRLLASDPVEGLELGRLEAALEHRTALVCLSHVNYRSGARVDMAAVAEVVHRAGSLLLWDLSHSVGALPIDLDGSDADLAVGCTYKYLNGGPGAPAFVYVRRDLQAQLRQPIWGWFGQRDQFAMGPTYDPEPGIARFLTGTPPVLGLMAVDAGVAQVAEAGIEALWAKSRELTAMLVQLIADRLVPLGCRLASPQNPDRRGAHVSLSSPLAWPLCAAGIRRGLVVPDFRPPDVVRLGPAPLYTSYTETWDALDRLAALLVEGGLVDSAGATRPRVT